MTLYRRLLVVMLIAVSCALSAPVRAQDADAAALTKEFLGQTPAQTRTPEQAAAAYTRVLESLLKDLTSTDVKTLNVAQESWERISLRSARPGAEAERVTVAKAMLPQLGPNSPQAVRLWLLKQLENMGRAEAVPTLTGLLNDTDPLVKERARRALQNDPAPAAAVALRTALAGATAPDWRVAIINALGYRRDAASVPAIARLLNDGDSNVAAAAASALGKIGGTPALQALTAFGGPAPAKPWVVDAEVRIAEQMLAQGQKAPALALYQRLYVPSETRRNRIAGLRGLVQAQGVPSVALLTPVLSGDDAEMRATAGVFTGLVPGPAMTRALVAALPRLPGAGAVTLLGALGNRGDATAKPGVVQALKSNDQTVRLAALTALGNLGDATDILTLAQVAATTTGEEGDTARRALAGLRGAGISDAMVRDLATAEPRLHVELIRGLAARRYTRSVPALLQSVNDTSELVRNESVKALGTIGDDSTVAPLVNLLAKTTDDTQRDALQNALKDVVDRSTNKATDAAPLLAALPNATGASRVAVITVLGRTGAPAALEALRAGAKETNADVQDAAIRQLANWPDAAAAPDLLELARNSDKPNYRVLALQGYVRLANDRPAGNRLKMLQDSADLAKRPEDKRMVLGALGNLNTLDALILVQNYLADNDVKEEAAAAAVRIARNMGDNVDPKVQPVLEKVIATAKNGDTTREANRILGKIKK